MKLTTMMKWHPEWKKKTFCMEVNHYYFLILGGY
jgi:hypothetical protein